jgi:hypothetical protein
VSHADDVMAMISTAFESAGLPYAIIGGHAVNVWLEPRFTADIDITAAADPEALAHLRVELAAAGYRSSLEHGADQPSGPDFVRFTRSPGDPPIEIQAAKTAFQVELIDRARQSAGGVAIATPEDLIVLKLIAHRPKDLIDLAGLVALPDLDWDYVEARARDWDLIDRLERARAAT